MFLRHEEILLLCFVEKFSFWCFLLKIFHFQGYLDTCEKFVLCQIFIYGWSFICPLQKTDIMVDLTSASYLHLISVFYYWLVRPYENLT